MSASNRSMTVTDIALRSGFLELGRFSVEYRQMFGESPSETLRQTFRKRGFRARFLDYRRPARQIDRAGPTQDVGPS